MWRLPTLVHYPSVVCPMVISQKLSKIDPWLLWYTIGKLAQLIMMPHSYPVQMSNLRAIQVSNTKYMYVQILMQPPTLASDDSCYQPSRPRSLKKLWMQFYDISDNGGHGTRNSWFNSAVVCSGDSVYSGRYLSTSVMLDNLLCPLPVGGRGH